MIILRNPAAVSTGFKPFTVIISSKTYMIILIDLFFLHESPELRLTKDHVHNQPELRLTKDHVHNHPCCNKFPCKLTKAMSCYIQVTHLII